MQETNKQLGVHVLLDLFDCPAQDISHVESVLKIGREVVTKSNLTLISEQYHQFEPFGVTVLFLLAESHLSIHTWPEKNIVACDIFCCTDKQTLQDAKNKIELASEMLVRLFKAQKSEMQMLLR